MEPPKKTCYHSELVRAGTVQVTMTSDVIASIKRKGTFFVAFNLNGYERQYTCENQSCADALRGRKGQTVNITATGGGQGQEHTAAIVVSGATGAPVPVHNPAPAPQQHAPAPAQHAPQPGYRPQSGTGDVAEAKRTLNRLANLYTLCLAAGDFVRTGYDETHEVPMPDSQYQGMVALFFISGERRGLAEQMPLGQLPAPAPTHNE